jgi:hypothetical protein
LTNPASDGATTVVSLRAIGDVAEGIVRRLEDLNATCTVELRPPMAVDEFRLR